MDALVFTDLDGTLLDHHTYRWDAARPALERLARAGVPVVLCSSKTRAEMTGLQERLGLRGPMVVENGGAVILVGSGPLETAFPDRLGGVPARVFGTPYPRLREALDGLRRLAVGRLRGFGDAAPDEIARWTGLAVAAAVAAAAREFDEPFLWEPEPSPGEVARAEAWLAARGLGLTRGGRFWHLTGDNDKGRAVRWVTDAVAAAAGRRPRTLALGDGPNDLPMLAAVDTGVLVARPDGTHLPDAPPEIRREPGIGPEGWRRAVEEWLDRSVVTSDS